MSSSSGREGAMTPPSSPRAARVPAAPRKKRRGDAIVDFTLVDALAALRNERPYVPMGVRGEARVAAAWELPPLGEYDLVFVSGMPLVVASGERVPVLCPQGGAVACFSSRSDASVLAMRDAMVAALCGTGRHASMFAVFVLGADRKRLERVSEEGSLRDRRDVLAVFIVEDYE